MNTTGEVLMAKRCQAKRKDGEACSAWALPDSRFCWAHDPKLKGKRRDARRNGGRSRGYPKDTAKHKVENLEDILKELNLLLVRAWKRDSTPSNDRVIVAILGSFESLLRPNEVEERLQTIEQRLGLSEVSD